MANGKLKPFWMTEDTWVDQSLDEKEGKRSECFPVKVVTIEGNDPDFVVPGLMAAR
ncbi:hypothetical protein CCACVL1_24936 [Corchorus capsularis]|uniref:Uncharacterized protein n=1 Tax=Corchorus capsularis TaxID=210143 RepID=A0A1R3GMN1_COCAP|nr:hypothetical protein CCACVL1_24936 [Corchorus capsularis]